MFLNKINSSNVKNRVVNTISKMKMTIKVRKTNKKEKIEFLIGTFIIILVILGFKIMK